MPAPESMAGSDLVIGAVVLVAEAFALWGLRRLVRIDGFTTGALAIAVLVEDFVVWGWYLGPPDVGDWGKLAIASAFPLVLVVAALLVYLLQSDA